MTRVMNWRCYCVGYVVVVVQAYAFFFILVCIFMTAGG